MSTVLDGGRGAAARANGQREDEISPNPPPLAPRRPPAAVELFGRSAECAALVACLRDGPRPPVTLVGPGGIGKTSLALQAAAALADDPAFPDGVAVAQLAPLVKTGTVVLALAESLGMTLHGRRPAVAWTRAVDATDEAALDRSDTEEAAYLFIESCDIMRDLEDWWSYSRSRALLVQAQVRRGGADLGGTRPRSRRACDAAAGRRPPGRDQQPPRLASAHCVEAAARRGRVALAGNALHARAWASRCSLPSTH